MRATGVRELALAGVIAAVALCAGRIVRAAEPTASPAVGVALGLHLEPASRYLPWLWEIRRSGASRVSLVVTWEQSDIAATRIQPSSETAPDDDVRQAVRDAHSVGLEVMLFPMIALAQAGEAEWRGRLAPASATAWFDSYREFILHYARIAQQEGVATYSVGSELGSMEQYDVGWRELIAAVRVAYEGTVIYSANWDHYDRTPFWDVLDHVGMTAYFEMPGASDAAAARSAWIPILEQIEPFATSVGRTVIFTEVGYTAQLGAESHPWNYTTAAPLDLATQAGLYDGAFAAFRGADWIEAVYAWNWFGAGGPRHDGYSPRNKPAENVLRNAATHGADEDE